MATPSKCTPCAATPTTSCTPVRNNYLSFPFDVTPHQQPPPHVADPSPVLPAPTTAGGCHSDSSLCSSHLLPHHLTSKLSHFRLLSSFQPLHMFHLTLRPSYALVTPANPTHSEPPTRATLQFCCTLYHSHCIINFKCKACLAFVFLVFQIFLETQ